MSLVPKLALERTWEACGKSLPKGWEGTAVVIPPRLNNIAKMNSS